MYLATVKLGLNLLESARLSGRQPIIVFTSTNKVYGGMEDVAVVGGETRYEYRDFPYGIPESRPLDFHSPYGCSKGAMDQYVRDYARIYDLPTVVFRMVSDHRNSKRAQSSAAEHVIVTVRAAGLRAHQLIGSPRPPRSGGMVVP